MEAQAARLKPAGRRWRHALESRRVLALLLIAPAVIFMALVVGVPFAWAIYLSFTNAIGGSLTGDWVGFDNFANAWQDENFQRALRNTLVFTLASQAIVLVGAAVVHAQPNFRAPARGAEINRNADRAGGRVRFLASVNCSSSETHKG